MPVSDTSPTENNNELTLQSYQAKTDEYIESTPPIDNVIKEWLDQALSSIPREGTVLEVGSGFGRDAEYIREKGFEVECSDAVPNFVEVLQKKGFKARLLNVITDEFGNKYDMILADAVLLHFTPEESASVMDKVYGTLPGKGIFALRMKKGNGPVWSREKLGEPRYFHYWQENDLKELLTDHGFEWLSMTESYTAHNDTNWMHIITRKV